MFWAWCNKIREGTSISISTPIGVIKSHFKNVCRILHNNRHWVYQQRTHSWKHFLRTFSISNLRFWRIFGGPREKLPLPRAVFTILSENNRKEKLLRWTRNEQQPRTARADWYSFGIFSSIVRAHKTTNIQYCQWSIWELTRSQQERSKHSNES